MTIPCLPDRHTSCGAVPILATPAPGLSILPAVATVVPTVTNLKFPKNVTNVIGYCTVPTKVK